MQKRIWESVGKDYEKFGDRVGWRNQSWLPYSDLKLTSNSPQGHLPLTHQVVCFQCGLCFGFILRDGG
ncbi:GUN4 domain-containing protein [Nostoc sp.]|uniref:GUN4 domain-containing protein n=1 Tax=Nostoc sp. TaxID=1180 RepID=UPI002FF5E665